MAILKLAVILTVVNFVKGQLRVCYYSNAAQHRPVPARITPEKIDPGLCTHLIYAFARLNESSEILFTEPKDGEMVDELNALKRVNPSLKTLLAVGGYNQGSTPFSDIAADANLRGNFARNAVQFLNEWGFDGLDLNWEFPAAKGGRRSADKRNYIALLREVRKQFDEDYNGLMLTAAIPHQKVLLQKGYDLEEMAKNLDFISLMAYDFHGDWERVAGHNSPLYQRSSEVIADTEKNVDWAANYFVTQNVPKEKLVIGLPAYGRSFRLANPNENSIGSRIRGAGFRLPYTNEYGFLAYNEVCELAAEGERKFEFEQKVPYLIHENHRIGYDDVESFEIKLNYIKENGYAGAMVWSIDMDDFGGLCPGFTHAFPLVQKMKDVLYEGQEDDQYAGNNAGQYDYQYGGQYDLYPDSYQYGEDYYYRRSEDLINIR